MQNVRTQITLPLDLKQWADRQSVHHDISLAEVVRQALIHEKEQQEILNTNRKEIAARIFSGPGLGLHPEWKTSEDVNAWVRSMREDSVRE